MKPLDPIRNVYVLIGSLVGVLFTAAIFLLSLIGSSGSSSGNTELFERDTVKSATCYFTAASALAAILLALLLQSGILAAVAAILVISALIAYFIAAD